MQQKQTGNKIIKKMGIAVFWLAVWQMAAVLVHNQILLAGPLESAQALVLAVGHADFWRTVGTSTARICTGFLSAFLLGVIVGSMAYHWHLLGELLGPVVNVMRSVPVAVFAVIFLIWFGATGLTVLVCFFMVFPNVYVSTVAGLESTDPQLLEVAGVLHAEWWKKLFFIYRPALLPYLNNCAQSALGMSWKSGVAAEVIGMPAYSLGERLYLSKIYLDTAGVFAWTFVIILCSLAFEKVFLKLLQLEAGRTQPLRRAVGRGTEHAGGGEAVGRGTEHAGGGEAVGRGPEHAGGGETAGGQQDVSLRAADLSASYGTQKIISQFNLTCRRGGIYCLMGASGQGKTTFLKLAAGLLEPSAGQLVGQGGSMMFQEDRLCLQADAVWNVCLARGVDKQKAQRHLERLLEPKECRIPAEQMSGGMRRRVALCRAVAADSRLLLLDEPFNGLDEKNRLRAIEYLRQEQEGRTILVATHREEDALLLHAEIIRLEG